MKVRRTRRVKDTGASSRPGVPYGATMGAIIGRRAEQQDAGRLTAARLPGGKAGLLIVVADGMGGHAGGAVASRIAVEIFERTFRAEPNQAVAKRLRGALMAANEAIDQEVKTDAGLRGMGCTLVAAVLEGRRLTWISVGDTLLLSAVGDRVVRLNADHSLGATLDERARRGEISHEEARTSPQRHMLRAAVTGERIALIDENETVLEADTLLVAATDGILTLPPERLGALLEQASAPDGAVAALLDAVAGDMPEDQDNTTVAAARVPSGPVPAPRSHSGERRRRPWRILAAMLAFLVVIASVVMLGLVVSQGAPDPKPSAPPPDPPVEPAAAVPTATAATPERPVPRSGPSSAAFGPASGKRPSKPSRVQAKPRAAVVKPAAPKPHAPKPMAAPEAGPKTIDDLPALQPREASPAAGNQP